MSFKIMLLPGDGIGPEVVTQARRVLDLVEREARDLELKVEKGLVGGASLEEHDTPLTDDVLARCQEADSILLGAVGGPRWDDLPMNRRPEKALLQLRKECELFANLRPAKVYPELVDSSPLKNELARRLDLLIVRELTGGVYFSLPKGIEGSGGTRRGFNTLSYTAAEIERITDVAVDAARKRQGKLTSVDKANVLESSQVWRETVIDAVPEDLDLNHLYVDNAAMQLIRDPGQFDVIVTGNLFGDILSDEAAQVCGSIGLLPSASLGESTLGMYEPVHGTAPDIAGEGLANPIAMILSVAMMFRFSLDRTDWADRIEEAVADVLAEGARTADLAGEDDPVCSTEEMGNLIIDRLTSRVSGGVA